MAAAGAAAKAPALYVSFASTLREQILAPVRAPIERGETGRALRSLEKARRKLLDRGDAAGLSELLDLAQRLPTAKARHEKARRDLIDAAQQNVRYIGRRNAINAGEEWSDPFAATQPKAASKLPSLPPMTRREIAIAAAIVVAIAGAFAAWALVSRAPQRVKHAIDCPTGEQGGPTWSPDGKQIAFAKNRECGTQITVISLEDDRLRTVTDRYGVLPDWSPDGRTILYRSSNGFSVVSTRGGKSHLLRSDDGNMGASWSPDGKRIAFTHGKLPSSMIPYESTLYVMDRDRHKTRRIVGHECDPGTPTWKPSTGELSFACSGRLYGVYLIRQSDGKLVRFARVPFDNSAYAPGFATIDVAWSPDGNHIAFSVVGSGSDDGLYVIDRDGSHRRLLTRF